MKKTLLLLVLISPFVMAFSGCDKDEDDTNNTTGPGTVSFELTNIVGNVNVDETGATSYTNASGESFTISKLKYYISNVQLMKDDAVTFTMPESYFLVDESNQASTKLSIPDVPAGSYNKIRFLIGVDSARNVSGAQTGALTPSDMFWTWSTGYIFFKMEGSSSASSNGSYIYHIAGFRDANNTNALRWVELDFNGSSLIVDGHRDAEIHAFVNVMKVFDGPPNPISIASHNNVMSTGGVALQIADNYAGMFTFDHLHNDPH
ncbi:MAG: hypothetical protein JNL88_03570 [Bacteroidia bacterium]|nr:hypothetical protein [Bacteroidia bacterium]